MQQRDKGHLLFEECENPALAKVGRGTLLGPASTVVNLPSGFSI